jgi:hypothetical protein
MTLFGSKKPRPTLRHTLEALGMFLLAIRVRDRRGKAEVGEQRWRVTAGATDFALLMTIFLAHAPEVAKWLAAERLEILPSGTAKESTFFGEEVDPSSLSQRVERLESRVEALESASGVPFERPADQAIEAAVAFLTAIGVRRHANGDPSLPKELVAHEGEEALYYEKSVVALRRDAPNFLPMLQLDEDDDAPPEPEGA